MVKFQDFSRTFPGPKLIFAGPNRIKTASCSYQILLSWKSHLPKFICPYFYLERNNKKALSCKKKKKKKKKKERKKENDRMNHAKWNILEYAILGKNHNYWFAVVTALMPEQQYCSSSMSSRLGSLVYGLTNIKCQMNALTPPQPPPPKKYIPVYISRKTSRGCANHTTWFAS